MGVLDSLDSGTAVFIFGIGPMYLILGIQFRSYWQPLIILSTVSMAFTGVVAWLLVTGNPLSLFTLYGVVAPWPASRSTPPTSGWRPAWACCTRRCMPRASG